MLKNGGQRIIANKIAGIRSAILESSNEDFKTVSGVHG